MPFATTYESHTAAYLCCSALRRCTALRDLSVFYTMPDHGHHQPERLFGTHGRGQRV
eukprot:SAG11_NODE_134_length_15338_cov_3.876435_6_plen_57_part_00